MTSTRLVVGAVSVSIRLGRTIVGREVPDEGSETRDRACDDRVCELGLCPGDVLGLEESWVGG